MSDSEADLSLALRRKRLFSDMIETDAWKEFLAIGLAQIENHMMTLIASPDEAHDGQYDVLRTYYRKGAIYGIRTLLNTPRDTIAQATEMTSNRQPKEYEDAERRSDSSPEQLELSVDNPDAVVTDLGG